MSLASKRLEYLVFILIIVVAALLRLPLISQGFFAFTFDQGRDLLEVAKIVLDHNLTLIGPTTGLPGIFYGPWWYYFLAPLFLIGQGDPLAITFFFGVIGMATVIFIYLLIRDLTKNKYVALTFAAVVAMSQPFLTSSSQIWSPSLVLPLMIIYLYALSRIFQSLKPVWFLVLGLSSGFIADSGAAFGIVLILATTIASIFFKKQFFKKRYLLFFAGLLIVSLPRIIFDLRNEFLITKSMITWLFSPLVYQEQLSFGQRLINRIDLFLHVFAQTFSQSNKLLSLVPLSFLAISAWITKSDLAKNKQSFSTNKMFKFLLVVILLIYFGFSFYPDAVWDYYLVGLPLIFLTTFALATSQLWQKSAVVTSVFLLLTVAVNFNQKLLSPFSITWQGDGAIYRNQKNVLDDLRKEMRGDYSLYVYTPARFDYPFDYLITWYAGGEKIDYPKDNQKLMYLIIRDDDFHSYLSSGWYGDKTQDKTRLLDRKDYPGNLIVEKHERTI